MAIIARFSFDVPFGMKAQAFSVMNKWRIIEKELGFPERRTLVGSIGSPESRIEEEFEFESLAQLEEVWARLDDPRMEDLQKELAPFIVAGSHRWEIFRIHDWP